MQSLKQQLLRNIGSHTSLNELHRLTLSLNYKISNCERRLRELCQTGLIQAHRNEKGVVVAYSRVKPQNDYLSNPVNKLPASDTDLAELSKQIKFGDVESLKLYGKIKKESNLDRKQFLIGLLKQRIGA